MSRTLIAFIVGVFIGVPLGIFIIGILQMAREELPPPKPEGNASFIPLKDGGHLCPVCGQPLDAWHSNRCPVTSYTENGKQKTENGTKNMPLYEYQCVDCQVKDHRIGGLDDHTALCVACGGLMLRLDQDIFLPYFQGKREGTAHVR